MVEKFGESLTLKKNIAITGVKWTCRLGCRRRGGKKSTVVSRHDHLASRLRLRLRLRRCRCRCRIGSDPIGSEGPGEKCQIRLP